jgi:hypothetical protein
MYDPTNRTSRRDLALTIEGKLASCGFAQTAIRGAKEIVYARAVDGAESIRVLVYTTVDSRDGLARSCGKDAIRVCAVYKARDGRERGIASADKRVNRVGEIDAIVGRMYDRMREVYAAARRSERCSCGAPKFTSKAGNAVCADLCWLSEAEVNRPAPRRRSRRGHRYGRRAPAATPAPTTQAWTGEEGMDEGDNGPTPGSWAATARMMAGSNPSAEEGEFWDRWKDEMKERDC